VDIHLSLHGVCMGIKMSAAVPLWWKVGATLKNFIPSFAEPRVCTRVGSKVPTKHALATQKSRRGQPNFAFEALTCLVRAGISHL
jgi:hypothetical protein